MFDGYKTGEGVPEELLGQFGLAERATEALGVVVWSMVEFEADDAMATAVAKWADAPGVEQAVICTPDKDLAQMVKDSKVVTLDRLQRDSAGRGRSDREVRGIAGVDSRLPGTGRGLGGWDPGYTALGGEVGGNGPGAVPAYRVYP